MRSSKLFFFLCLLLPLSGVAADLPGMTRLFKKSFWTDHYEQRFCGKNIEKLVRKGLDAGVDLSGAEIIEITDISGWMFQMLNALQAREAGGLITPARVSPPFRNPGEKNWHFHVVLLVEGRILDYDFTNEAQTPLFKAYLNEMFIPKNKRSDEGYKRSKMSLYQITSYPAEDYILRQNQRLGVKEISRSKYLRDYMPEFFTGY
jgi:hypothetical protein